MLPDVRERLILRAAWFKFRLDLAACRTPPKPIIVLQSCDQTYLPILNETSSVNRRYAERMGYVFAQFVGNISFRPRTANFNRYYLLRAASHNSHLQWALWMDADAIVADPTLPLEPIIKPDRDKLIIACSGRNRRAHDINNGIFFFNLRHRDTNRLLRYMIAASRRRKSNPTRFVSDQRHMQAWLRRRLRPDDKISCLRRYEGAESSKFNYDGPFIQHVLNRWGNLQQRLDRLRLVRRASEEKMAAAGQPAEFPD